MGASGGFPIDLLLFAMIAAFLVLRLRSILGRRTGFERPPADPATPPVGMARTAPGLVPDEQAEQASSTRPLRAAASTSSNTLPTLAVGRATLSSIASSGNPVTFARVMTGIPIEPKATGAVLASRQMPAA